MPDKKNDLPFDLDDDESTKVSPPPKFGDDDDDDATSVSPPPSMPKGLGDDDDEATEVVDWDRATRKSIENVEPKKK